MPTSVKPLSETPSRPVVHDSSKIIRENKVILAEGSFQDASFRVWSAVNLFHAQTPLVNHSCEVSFSQRHDVWFLYAVFNNPKRSSLKRKDTSTSLRLSTMGKTTRGAIAGDDMLVFVFELPKQPKAELESWKMTVATI